MTTDEIKQSVSMRQVLEERGIKVNRSSFCCCPFHSDKHASMKVYQNSVYCFSECNKAWDLFSFVMDYDGVDFPTAFQSLGGTYERMTPAKKQELDEIERKRKQARVDEDVWHSQEQSNGMLLHTYRELAKKQEQPYIDSEGNPVYPDDWLYFIQKYWNCCMKDEELQREGRDKGWI